MSLYKLGDQSPRVDKDCYIADTATIIGNVTLGPESSVWFGAVIRGDNERIEIGAQANVQDNAVLHTDPGYPMTLGARVTVGHQATLHGCSIDEDTLIGMQAIVLNGASIGKNSIVGAGALVTEGKSFPAGSLILGSPAKVVAEVTDEQIAMIRHAANSYVERGRRYRADLAADECR